MAMLEVIEEYGGAGSMTHFKHIYSRTNFDTTWPKACLSTWWLLYPLLPQRRSESYSRLLFDLMCRNTEPSPCLPPTPPPPPASNHARGIRIPAIRCRGRRGGGGLRETVEVVVPPGGGWRSRVSYCGGMMIYAFIVPARSTSVFSDPSAYNFAVSTIGSP
jgi:hypothetical protein